MLLILTFPDQAGCAVPVSEVVVILEATPEEKNEKGIHTVVVTKRSRPLGVSESFKEVTNAFQQLYAFGSIPKLMN